MSDNAAPTPKRARFGPLARLALSVVVLGVVLAVVSPLQVWRAMVSVGPGLWLAALALYLTGHVVSAYKWRILVDPHGRFGEALRAHFSGLLANLALPGVATGDVVRAGVMARRSQDRAGLAMGSLADRLIDTLGLTLLAAMGLAALAHDGAPSALAPWLVAIALLTVAAAAASRALLPRLLKSLPESGKFSAILHKLGGASLTLLRRPDKLALCLALSMAVQAAFVQINIAMGQAAGALAPAGAWFFAWPTSKIIAAVPISAGGVGVREASLAGLMTPFGADAAAVVAAGLVWQSIVIAGALAGAGAAWLTRGETAETATHGA